MKDMNNLRDAGFSMTCLDIGARWGFNTDLLSIAPIIDAIGFEPDTKECNTLNKNIKNHPWKSMRFLPTALGTGAKTSLNLYRQRGCSSLLEANQELAKRFSRDSYYIFDGKADVAVMPMDEAAIKYGFEKAAFMKIDIQGAEMDVFDSGSILLKNSIVGIRTEVSFLPIYKNQPVFWEIDRFLCGLGFNLMSFSEEHHWRRSALAKYPFPSKGKYALSKGQLVHGDALYLRAPENMPVVTEENKKKRLELALISAAYGCIDHAQAALSQTGMKEYLDRFNVNADSLLRNAHDELKQETRKDLFNKIWQDTRKLMRNL